ncbi:MAG TPA: TlpA disulfide reductase family protein [Gemmatirosa sp.]
MTARQQWTIIGAIVALLGGGLWVASRTLGEELFPISVGGPAPAFTANALQTAAPGGVAARPAAGARGLADYRGQVVLLNIWATWCGPCRAEIPSLEALYRDFGPRGFKIVAVSVDEGADAPQKIREFLAPYHVTYDVLHDSAGTIQKTYQTTGVPENFVIGADGVVRKKAYAQDWNSPENRALIGRLLDEPATR